MKIEKRSLSKSAMNLPFWGSLFLIVGTIVLVEGTSLPIPKSISVFALILALVLMTYSYWRGVNVQVDGKKQVNTLIEGDIKDGFAITDRISSNDTADAILIGVDGRIKAYQIEETAISAFLKIFTFDHYDEIEGVEIVAEPEGLQVKTDKSSESKLLVGGALVGGVPGLVHAMLFKSVFDGLKSDHVDVVFKCIFRLKGGTPFIFRAVHKRCRDPKTDEGQRKFKEAVLKVGSFVSLIDKYFSDKVVTPK